MFRLFFIILIGVFFVSLGIFFYQKIKNALMFFSTGFLLIYMAFFGDLSSSCEKIDFIKNINPNDVSLIKIQPTRIGSSRDISLVKEEEIIDNEVEIYKICTVLKKSKSVGDEFLKNPKKVCRIEIEFKNGKKIFLGLKINNDYACLTLNSRGESGWHYGKLESNEFGFLIKKKLMAPNPMARICPDGSDMSSER